MPASNQPVKLNRIRELFAMRDVHCHILPGVDDGARTMSESLLMLSEAMKAGVTSIVCTPRCCDPWFNFERMWQAFLQLKHHASAIPGAPELSMGFEVEFHKLKQLGMDAAVQLGNDQGEFLLELPEGTLPLDWEYVVHNLQRKGFKVIIAHPERCREVQKDIEVARRFVLAGCELQISAGCVYGGLLDPARRAAKKLVQAGMVHHLASDARCPDDYELLTEAMEYFKRVADADADAMENKPIEGVERQCAEAEARAEGAKRGRSFGFDDLDAPAAEGSTQPGDSGERRLTSGQEAYRAAKAAAERAGEQPAVVFTGAASPSVVHPAEQGKKESTAASALRLGDLPLPSKEAPKRASHAAAGQDCADVALDAMYDDAPIRGKHARKA